MNAVTFPTFLTTQACDRRVTRAGVRVWKVWLGEEVETDCWSALLSADEANRAARFVFPRDRRRFVLTRAALRLVLGDRLDQPAERLRFAYGPHGKPELLDDSRHGGIQFNVAHSGDWALIALACGQRVGVDVEQLRPLAEYAAIARRNFSRRETTALESLPAEHREEAFFRCWTRKEAYLKALGCGLSQGLDRFDVSLLPGEPAALLASIADASAPGRWQLAEICPASSYIGTVAVETGQGLANERHAS